MIQNAAAHLCFNHIFFGMLCSVIRTLSQINLISRLFSLCGSVFHASMFVFFFLKICPQHTDSPPPHTAADLHHPSKPCQILSVCTGPTTMLTSAECVPETSSQGSDQQPPPHWPLGPLEQQSGS